MIKDNYNYTPLSRESDDGHRVYCLPDGSKVPSVTTILSNTKPHADKEALNNWRKRVGQTKAQEITTESANRGTRMHKWLETYVQNNRDMGKPGSNPYSIQSHSMATTIVENGLVHVPEVWGIEVPLYVSGLYAGTTDMVGIHKDKPAILDYKQTNKPKKTEWISDYFIQLCAYGLAHNEMYGTNINTGVVLMCSPALEYQEWVITGDEWDIWTEKWLARVEQYYNLV